MARKPADKVGLMVRMPESLRRLIERSAKANNRSMNIEIVARLGQSFQSEDYQRVLTTTAETAAEKAVRKFVLEHIEHPGVRRSLGIVLEKDMAPDVKAPEEGK